MFFDLEKQRIKKHQFRQNRRNKIRTMINGLLIPKNALAIFQSLSPNKISFSLINNFLSIELS